MHLQCATVGFVCQKGSDGVCSVTAQEVVDAIASQTGRTLDKKNFDLPDIKKLGTYDVSVRLHPNVVGKFKVVVQKQKEQR